MDTRTAKKTMDPTGLEMAIIWEMAGSTALREVVVVVSKAATGVTMLDDEKAAVRGATGAKAEAAETRPTRATKRRRNWFMVWFGYRVAAEKGRRNETNVKKIRNSRALRPIARYNETFE